MSKSNHRPCTGNPWRIRKHIHIVWTPERCGWIWQYLPTWQEVYKAGMSVKILEERLSTENVLLGKSWRIILPKNRRIVGFLFQFSDILLYTSRSQATLQFKVHGHMPLRGVLIEEPEGELANCGFIIYGIILKKGGGVIFNQQN